MLLAIPVMLAGCTNAANFKPIDPNKGGIWDKYFVYPLSWTLDWFKEILWGSYGLSIIVVTLIIRFIIFPLTLKQYRSSKQMQVLQPELKKIKEKYKDDTKKQQEETMKLFQKHGVNPLAGCLPLLVQMPILYALYFAIMRTPEIREASFLGIELGSTDHTYILPILAALTTFLQQKIMMSTTTANPQMRGIMYIFPVLIFVMAQSFPAALPLYWVVSNLFTMVQTYFIYGGSQKGGLSNEKSYSNRKNN
ncbi:MAG TPA: membrane protein insertase YidC [Bacilli bacterium]